MSFLFERARSLKILVISIVRPAYNDAKGVEVQDLSYTQSHDWDEIYLDLTSCDIYYDMISRRI